MQFNEWLGKKNINEAFGDSIDLDEDVQEAICFLRNKDLNHGFDISSLPEEFSPSSGNLVLTGQQLEFLFQELVKKWKSIPSGLGKRIEELRDRAEAANVFRKYLNSVGQIKDFDQQKFTIKCPIQ
jgi:hypothetical protein